MMRKAQDRAGLHGGLGGLQGMKGLAGFGANLASNKFVRAAIREEVRGSRAVASDPMVAQTPTARCACAGASANVSLVCRRVLLTLYLFFSAIFSQTREFGATACCAPLLYTR